MAAVAQPSRRDIHPLLRHPRPITRDSAKAQRMLGLISDTEDKETGLRREKSKTTKWLERPMYAHLEISDAESDKDDIHDRSQNRSVSEPRDDEKYVDLLLGTGAKADRPTSISSSLEDATQITVEPKTKVDASFNRKRPEPLRNLRPISYNSQHLLTPEWTASPATMSPVRPTLLQHGGASQHRNSVSSTSSTGSDPRFAHPHSWPAPMPQHHLNGRLERPASYQPPGSSKSDQGKSWSLGSPQLTERRPRPTSFATYQHRDRRNSKIASSRGLRNDSYPNFSRPMADAPPKTVPGESIESDSLHNRVSDIEVGLPLPASSVCGLPNSIEPVDEQLRNEKKSKHRWSTIPSTFKKFTIRRSSGSAHDPKPDTYTNDLHRVSVVGDHDRDPAERIHSPATPRFTHPGRALLPTPSYSPLDFKHPFAENTLPPPFAPWATDAPPSPALSHDIRRGSETSLSPTRKRASSRLSVENMSPSRPTSMHSRNSSFGMPSPRNLAPPPHTPTHVPVSPRPGSSRRGTPTLERTCIVCKTTQEPTAFINRRIAANCWHEPATCYGCLQAHIEKSVIAQGWEHCSCPECGERLTYDDMGAFADDDTFVRWDD